MCVCTYAYENERATEEMRKKEGKILSERETTCVRLEFKEQVCAVASPNNLQHYFVIRGGIR